MAVRYLSMTPFRFPHLVACAAAAVLSLSAALSETSAQQASLINPFEQTNAAPVVADAGDADLNALEFSGVAAIVDQRSFNFTDTRTRKNFWVPLNGTENGFTVESYDERAEQVVVRRGTHTRPITLRKTQLVALPVPANHQPYTPPPITTAAATAPRAPGPGVDELKNPKTPAEIKQAEYEARMLVSDLLDISMQERARQKALREAQARGQTPQAVPPPPTRR
jgi:hypothetical protein